MQHSREKLFKNNVRLGTWGRALPETRILEKHASFRIVNLEIIWFPRENFHHFIWL